jgi:hypothetical protein
MKSFCGSLGVGEVLGGRDNRTRFIQSQSRAGRNNRQLDSCEMAVSIPRSMMYNSIAKSIRLMNGLRGHIERIVSSVRIP